MQGPRLLPGGRICCQPRCWRERGLEFVNSLPAVKDSGFRKATAAVIAVLRGCCCRGCAADRRLSCSSSQLFHTLLQCDVATEKPRADRAPHPADCLAADLAIL